MIKPSDVTRPLMNTPWKNSERETVLANVLKLARFKNDDEWSPFSWDDYVKFCSHVPIQAEQAILDEFVETGYLSKDANGFYGFKQKIIGVYMQYTD